MGCTKEMKNNTQTHTVSLLSVCQTTYTSLATQLAHNCQSMRLSAQHGLSEYPYVTMHHGLADQRNVNKRHN